MGAHASDHIAEHSEDGVYPVEMGQDEQQRAGMESP
jgi:hypothetical protein